MPRQSFESGPTEFSFKSTDGLAIRCARWDSYGPARGVVQIAHGLGEHLGRYLGTIGALTAAGFTVYGNDHRGHGRTAVSKDGLGDFGAGGFKLLAEDLGRLRRIARDISPAIPFFLLGHGLGAFAAQYDVLDHSRELDGLVLFDTGDLAALAGPADAAAAESNPLNRTFEPARTPFDWLSRDSAVVDEFIQDPLCFAHLRPASLASFLAAGQLLADPGRLRAVRGDLPVYIISGSDDPVGQRLTGVETLIGRYRGVGILDISQDFYCGGRHEMLNDTHRDEVRARLIRWLDKRVEKTRVGVAARVIS